MKIYDFKIAASDKSIIDNMGSDGEMRCRTNNDGSGLFIGSGNAQLLHNGYHPDKRMIRSVIRQNLIDRWQANTRNYSDVPKFRLVMVNTFNT